MKKIILFVSLVVFSTQFTFSQDKALYIDQDGKVGINTTMPSQQLDVNGSMNVSGTINGTNFYEFDSSTPSTTLSGIGDRYSTLTLSYYTNCQSYGLAAVIAYDIYTNQLEIVSQGGSGGNNAKIKEGEPNTILFYDSCGGESSLSFTKTATAGEVTVSPVIIKGPIQFTSFKVMSQGF